jgi:hypothetical protein
MSSAYNLEMERRRKNAANKEALRYAKYGAVPSNPSNRIRNKGGPSSYGFNNEEIYGRHRGGTHRRQRNLSRRRRNSRRRH